MSTPTRVAPASTECQMRPREYRRHQAERHMWRRLKEDRNQHYNDLTCPCWSNPKSMAFFKEQPKRCGKSCCANPRRKSKYSKGERTIQEQKFYATPIED